MLHNCMLVIRVNNIIKIISFKFESYFLVTKSIITFMIKNNEGYLEDTNLAGLLDYKSTFDNSRIFSVTNFPKNYNNFHIMSI